MTPLQHALGLDIGGTKIAIGVVAADGRVLACRTIATESRRGPPDATNRIARAVEGTLQACGLRRQTMTGVGVGCAGPVNPLRGEINNPYTLPGWEGWNIVRSLQDALDVPVWLENDADAAALGEYFHGAGQAADSVAMLTFGTGVGGALISHGEIYRGTEGEHPEIGHLPVTFGETKCYCGRQGCLESVASGTAIAAAGARCDLESAAHVFAAAATGNPAAQTILAGVQRAIATATWTLLHAYLPARIILGGGLVDAHPEFYLDAARAAARNAQLISRTAVEIAPARLGNRAGLVGAARWAIERGITSLEPARQSSSPPLPSSP